MVLSKGEKVFVIIRRLFEKDLRRNFIGEILEVSEAAIRARGYMFVFDEATRDFIRRDKLQTNIYSLTDGGIVVIVLSEEINLIDTRYIIDDKGQRILTDGKALSLQVSEFGVNV